MVNSSCSTPIAIPGSSLACPPTISVAPASFGAILCMIGTPTDNRTLPGGRPGCVMALSMVDRIRLDHFRGFDAAWHVPPEASLQKTANGSPVRTPNFRQVQGALEVLPLVAEDLGVITPSVERLRNQFGLPGMRILQFAFGGTREERFLPHNYDRNTVAYSGTHDNDTSLGWYYKLTTETRRFRVTIGPRGGRRLGPDSPGVGLGCRPGNGATSGCFATGQFARMNLPGQPQGNWRWRLPPDVCLDAAFHRLGEMTDAYDRAPANPAHVIQDS